MKGELLDNALEAPVRAVNGARKICLCMSVTDQEIAACYAAGHRSLDEIRTITRACTRCFGCEADLRSFYNDVLVTGRFRMSRRGAAGLLGYLGKRYDLYRLAQTYYHRHLRWRLHPMTFSSIVIERPDLHTRYVTANLNRRPDLEEFKAVELAVRLLDHQGQVVSSGRYRVGQDAT